MRNAIALAAVVCVGLVTGCYTPPEETADVEQAVSLPPVSKMPLEMMGVAVGATGIVVFDLPFPADRVATAQLELLVNDFDDPAEQTIAFNGAPLPIPESLIGEGTTHGGRLRPGTIPIPATQLRDGRNEVVFTFASDLNGKTRGFEIVDARLIVAPKSGRRRAAVRRRDRPEAPTDRASVTR